MLLIYVILYSPHGTDSRPADGNSEKTIYGWVAKSPLSYVLMFLAVNMVKMMRHNITVAWEWIMATIFSVPEYSYKAMDVQCFFRRLKAIVILAQLARSDLILGVSMERLGCQP